jgi:chorismate mutase
MATFHEEYWKTKDGRTIAVADMSEEHVRNALRVCIRRIRQQQEEDDDDSLQPSFLQGTYEYWKD